MILTARNKLGQLRRALPTRPREREDAQTARFEQLQFARHISEKAVPAVPLENQSAILNVRILLARMKPDSPAYFFQVIKL
jgi:hypothetical protein